MMNPSSDDGSDSREETSSQEELALIWKSKKSMGGARKISPKCCSTCSVVKVSSTSSSATSKEVDDSRLLPLGKNDNSEVMVGVGDNCGTNAGVPSTSKSDSKEEVNCRPKKRLRKQNDSSAGKSKAVEKATGGMEDKKKDEKRVAQAKAKKQKKKSNGNEKNQASDENVVDHKKRKTEKGFVKSDYPKKTDANVEAKVNPDQQPSSGARERVLIVRTRNKHISDSSNSSFQNNVATKMPAACSKSPEIDSPLLDLETLIMPSPLPLISPIFDTSSLPATPEAPKQSSSQSEDESYSSLSVSYNRLEKDFHKLDGAKESINVEPVIEKAPQFTIEGKQVPEKSSLSFEPESSNARASAGTVPKVLDNLDNPTLDGDLRSRSDVNTEAEGFELLYYCKILDNEELAKDLVMFLANRAIDRHVLDMTETMLISHFPRPVANTMFKKYEASSQIMTDVDHEKMEIVLKSIDEVKNLNIKLLVNNLQRLLSIQINCELSELQIFYMLYEFVISLDESNMGTFLSEFASKVKDYRLEIQQAQRDNLRELQKSVSGEQNQNIPYQLGSLWQPPLSNNTDQNQAKCARFPQNVGPLYERLNRKRDETVVRQEQIDSNQLQKQANSSGVRPNENENESQIDNPSPPRIVGSYGEAVQHLNPQVCKPQVKSLMHHTSQEQREGEQYMREAQQCQQQEQQLPERQEQHVEQVQQVVPSVSNSLLLSPPQEQNLVQKGQQVVNPSVSSSISEQSNVRFKQYIVQKGSQGVPHIINSMVLLPMQENESNQPGRFRQYIVKEGSQSVPRVVSSTIVSPMKPDQPVPQVQQAVVSPMQQSGNQSVQQDVPIRRLKQYTVQQLQQPIANVNRVPLPPIHVIRPNQGIRLRQYTVQPLQQPPGQAGEQPQGQALQQPQGRAVQQPEGPAKQQPQVQAGQQPQGQAGQKPRRSKRIPPGILAKSKCARRTES